MSVSIYHCLCTELLLASSIPFQNVPKRQSDKSLICTTTDGNAFSPDSTSILEKAITVETTPVVLKLEDGFEKRYLVRCGRCGVVVGYVLDLSLFDETKGKVGVREGVVYVLEGAVVGTEMMRVGRTGGDGEGVKAT